MALSYSDSKSWCVLTFPLANEQAKKVSKSSE